MTFHLHLVLLWNVSSTSQKFEYKYSESGTLAFSSHKQVLFFHLRRSNFQSYYSSYIKYEVFAITQALLKCYIEDFLNYSCAANLNCSSQSWILELFQFLILPWFVNSFIQSSNPRKNKWRFTGAIKRRRDRYSL